MSTTTASLTLIYLNGIVISIGILNLAINVINACFPCDGYGISFGFPV